MKIGITGHEGDAGSGLVRLFKLTESIVNPVRVNIDFHFDRIIHTAAMHPVHDVKSILDSNIIYLQQIIDYSIRLGVKEFVFFSSTSVYKDDMENLNEDSDLRNDDVYSVTKIIGEELIYKSGLNGLSIRIPGLLEFQKSYCLMSKWFDLLLKNMPVEISNPDKLFNGYISIEEIFTFINSFKAFDFFDTVNLATLKSITVKDTVEIIKRNLNSSSEIIIKNAIYNTNFRSYCIDKAITLYGFKPEEPENVINRWCTNRKELYESCNS